MSEDRTTGGATPDADTDGSLDVADGGALDADATRAYAVSPADADETVEGPAPGTGSAAAPAVAPADGGDREADRPRWTQSGASTGSATPPSPSGSSAVSGAAATGAPTTVLPSGGSRPARPTPARPDRPASEPRSAGRPQSRPAGRRRARLVLQRVDAWSVFLFSLVASICLGVVLFVAVTALYAALSSLGVLGSLNGLLGEVAGSGTGEEVVEPFITSGRVLGATAVLAAVDVVLLTALATLGALLYNLCASLTGGIEVQLGERE